MGGTLTVTWQGPVFPYTNPQSPDDYVVDNSIDPPVVTLKTAFKARQSRSYRLTRTARLASGTIVPLDISIDTLWNSGSRIRLSKPVTRQACMERFAP